jgi:2-hydroxy-3-keto-5-methylthiopentenyl-1-phosphate phosphatase
VMGRRLLNTDEYLFNRKQFINFFKEPNIGFNQVDQLMELSKAVNERLVKLVQAEAK